MCLGKRAQIARGSVCGFVLYAYLLQYDSVLMCMSIIPSDTSMRRSVAAMLTRRPHFRGV